MPRPPSGIADLIRLASGSLLLHGYAAAGRVMRHAHRTVCIVGLHSGSREYFFGNDVLRLHCGQLLVIAAGHVHGCGAFLPQSKGDRGNDRGNDMANGEYAGGQGYEEGYEEGRTVGRTVGCVNGCVESCVDGCTEGCVNGYTESRADGCANGCAGSAEGRMNEGGSVQEADLLYSTLCVSVACLPVAVSRIVTSPELVARLRDLDDASEGAFLEKLAALLAEGESLRIMADDTAISAGNRCPQEIAVAMRSFLKELEHEADTATGWTGGASVRFSRQFRAAVGLPPVAWQMLCRIRHGASLLAGGASITDAALASGFYDQSHFAHRFRQLMGMTPGQYQVAFSGSKDR